MSYTGIIHRQDVDTGVTIRAKAITPNKMKAAVKDYKVTVRKNPEDVYKIAMAANANAKNAMENLIAEGDPDDQGELDFTALLDSTTTKITIENDDSKNGTPLNECYNEDGSFKARPKIGEPAAYGWLVITTTITSAESGATASVSSKIYVTVAAAPAETLFSVFTQKFWWDNELRGVNSEMLLGNLPEVGGNLNIRHTTVDGNGAVWHVDASTKKAKNINEALFPMLGARSHVIIETTVTDAVAATTKLWGQSIANRINLEDGSLQGTIPTFKQVATYLVDSPVEMRPYFNKNIEPTDNTVRAWYTCSGLKVTCTLYLTVPDPNNSNLYIKDTTPGNSKTIEFNLTTRCGYMTNDEAIEKIAADPNFKMTFLTDSFNGNVVRGVPYSKYENLGELTATVISATEELFMKTVANHYAKQIGSENAEEGDTYRYIYNNVPVMFSISQVGAYASDGTTPLESTKSTELFSKSDPSDICELIPEDGVDAALYKYRGVAIESDNLTDQEVIFFKAVLSVNAYSTQSDVWKTTTENNTVKTVNYCIKIKFDKSGSNA